MCQLTRPNYDLQEKEKLLYCGLCCPSRPQSKIERKRKKKKYVNLASELKYLEYEKDGGTNSNWFS